MKSIPIVDYATPRGFDSAGMTFDVPPRSAYASVVLRWVYILPLMALAILATGAVAAMSLGFISVSAAIVISVLCAAVIAWLAGKWLYFVFAGHEVQSVSVTGEAILYTNANGRRLRFDLSDLEEVIIAARVFGLAECSDLVLLSRTSREFTRLLWMYDDDLLARVANFLQQHAKAPVRKH